MKTAIYAGSFDPLHYGHIDVIKRGLAVFDHLIVAVARNISKRGLFTIEERLVALNEVFEGTEHLTCEAFDGLLVDFARARGADALLRGLRSPRDFDYEAPMVTMNRHLHPKLETVFVIGEPSVLHLSSSLIKEVAQFGGDITGCVPESIQRALLQRIEENKKEDTP